MKRFLTILFVVAFASSAIAADYEFGWTLSDSATDPWANQGTFASGILNLHLHYFCTTNATGLASAEFDLAPDNPANISLAFTPANGFLNAGGAGNLLLAVGGCPFGPVQAGTFLVSSNVAGEYCLAPSAANGLNVSVNCVQLNTSVNAYIGYSNTGTAPCQSADVGCVVAVEAESWGAIKSLYR